MSLAALQCPRRRTSLGGIGVAVFMLALATVDALTRGRMNLPALIPPFGASVVIVFLTPESPYGRPWNVIAGHLLSACAAGLMLWLFPDLGKGALAALAVSGAGLLMVATRSFHPPGGATALLVVLSDHPPPMPRALIPLVLASMTLAGIRFILDRTLAFSTGRQNVLPAVPETPPGQAAA